MFELPGPQRFFREIVKDLNNKKHVVLVLPDPLHNLGIVKTLIPLCQQHRLGDVCEADVGPERETDVHVAIEKLLVSDGSRLPTVRDLLLCLDAESQIYVLKNGFKGDSKRQSSFSRHLSKMSKETNLLEGEIEVQFVVLASPGDTLPNSDLYLTIHPWWGVVGELDVEVAVEEQLIDSPPPLWTDHYWIRSICKGLAQGDPDLGKRLVEDMPKTLNDISEVLTDYIDFDSAPHTQFDMKASFYGEPLDCLPKGKMTPHWRCGCLNCVDGIGQQIHSSLVATEANGSCEIERRVWQGQQKVLWPVVEQVRISIISSLEDRFGASWMKRIGKGVDVDRQALETEIGALSHVVFKHRARSPRDIPNNYTLLAKEWKDIRNQLAHCEMLSYETVKNGLIMFRKFIDQP